MQVQVHRGGGWWQTLQGGVHPDWSASCEAYGPSPVCPTGQFAEAGWELCAWDIADNVVVPQDNEDLLGVDGLDVRHPLTSVVRKGLPE